MDNRWAYPTPITMQRQTGSAPKARDLARALPNAVKSPPVAPDADAMAREEAGAPQTEKTPGDRP